MKKHQIIFVILFLSSLSSPVISQTYSKWFVFPINHDSPSWNKYTTAYERINDLQIPATKLPLIPTADLLDICLDFPYLPDILFFDNLQEGYNVVSKKFNGFKELYSRNDLVPAIRAKEKFILKQNCKQDSVYSYTNGNIAVKNLFLMLICIYNNCLDRDIYNNCLTGKITDWDFSFSSFHFDYLGQYIENKVKEILYSKSILNQSKEKSLQSGSYILTTTITTPCGNVVPDTYIFSGQDMTSGSSDYNYRVNYVHNNYPNATIVGPPSYKYNCHGYAWNVSEGGNQVWIGLNYIGSDSIYWTDGSYIEVPKTSATKVSYGSANHSAVIYDETMFKSKWGNFPLVIHLPNDVPYDTLQIKKYYIKKPFIYGPDMICSQETFSISNLHSGESIIAGLINPSGYSIQVSNHLIVTSYSNGSLNVLKTSNGKGVISVYYKGYLLSSKEVWVGAPIVKDVYFMGGNIYIETDWESGADPLYFYIVINGRRYRLLGGVGNIPLSNGTYNVEAYAGNQCGESDHYYGQIVVYGSGLYSLGSISADHQVTIEAVDYSESPQPLEAMQTMTSKQAAKDVPYELKNAMTGEVSARGEMPAEGGVIDFSRVRSGLYVLTLSPAGREPETFKISLK